MQEHCEILLYFDKNDVLLHMRKECEKFVEELTEKTIRKFPPFRFNLEVDVLLLLDEFPELGHLLLNEPVKWREMSSNILYSCLNTIFKECEDIIQREQVAVILSLKSLPFSLVYKNVHQYQGLVCIQGVLTEVAKLTNYVMHSVWSCREECEDSEIILHYIPKNPPKCFICKGTLYENSGSRICGDQVLASFMLKDELLCRKFKINDGLINKLTLGSKYILIGVALKKTILIWSLEAINPLPAPITMPIPSELDELYTVCKGTPWKFVNCLSSSIGINVCPLSCFMHLKISLILSLSTVIANAFTGCAIVHVLAAGFDTGYVEALMNIAASLSDRFVRLGTANTSVPSTLIASNGGVSVLTSPLHVYHQKQISAVLSAIESNEVVTENGRVKLRCAIWAHGMDMKKIVLLNVASVFGSVCRADFGDSNDDVTNFILQQAVEATHESFEEKRAMNDIKIYLDSVAGIHVGISESAETLLKNYFMAARKDRPRGVTAGSMSSLAATCMASARLCRRTSANVDDAVFAVWLHESGSPEPRSAPEEYLQIPPSVKTLHKNMSNFKDWLAQFTGYTHIPLNEI